MGQSKEAGAIPHIVPLREACMYETLPKPANLASRGLRENQLCNLCGKKGTLAYILASWNTGEGTGGGMTRCSQF